MQEEEVDMAVFLDKIHDLPYRQAVVQPLALNDAAVPE
jgi:hypothetical protein